MSKEPSLVYEEDKVVLEFLGVRERSIVGKVVVVGLIEVVEGGGEGGESETLGVQFKENTRTRISLYLSSYLNLSWKSLVDKFGPIRDLNQQGFENANSLNNTDQQRHTTAKKILSNKSFFAPGVIISMTHPLQQKKENKEQLPIQTMYNLKHIT